MIIYIAGYGRSGSTAFAKLVHDSTNAAWLGEIVALSDKNKRQFVPKEYDEFIKSNTESLSQISRLDSVFCFRDDEWGYNKYLNTMFEWLDTDCIVDSSKTTYKSFRRPYNIAKTGMPIKVFLLKPGYRVIASRMLKGKNSHLELGIHKSLLKRMVYVIIAILHYFLAVEVWGFIYKKRLNVVEITSTYYTETFVQNLFESNRAYKGSFKITQPVYGNRLRKNSI